MKKVFLVAVMAIVSVAYAAAQPRAIGGNIGYGISFSYQHSLGAANMIDLVAEVPCFNGIGATCTYDWINPFSTSIPWDYRGSWNWAMGVGAGLGMGNFKAPNLYFGVVGHVGIAYDFWFPMELSFDYRPNIGLVSVEKGVGFNTTGLYSGITLGIRYLF